MTAMTTLTAMTIMPTVAIAMFADYTASNNRGVVADVWLVVKFITSLYMS